MNLNWQSFFKKLLVLPRVVVIVHRQRQSQVQFLKYDSLLICLNEISSHLKIE